MDWDYDMFGSERDGNLVIYSDRCVHLGHNYLKVGCRLLDTQTIDKFWEFNADSNIFTSA